MKNIHPDNFAKRIIVLLKYLEEEQKLKQKDFAEKLGISPGHVTNLKKGKAISDSLIKNIARTFCIDEVWLKTGEGEMFRPAGEGEGRAAQGGYQHPNLKIQKIVEMLESMDENTQEDILLSVEKEKLLRDLLQEKRDKKAG
jgi:transcriptional regulator with XRE-family HTH domain